MPDSDSRPHRPDSFEDAHEAARRKIEHQVEVGKSLDNKALRTFRYILLTAGVVLTGLSISGVESLFVPETATDAIYLLFGAILSIPFFLFATITSIFASRESNIDLGPSQEDIEDVLDDRPSKGEWLESALERQSDLIEQNNEQLKSDQRYLLFAQFFFVIMFFGLFLLFLAIF